ncbi:MAG TPA: YihY/virulence factor BrkB family protein [Ilumatobacteraceae bacterium]|nr:YihY/virulence factor BrkB family protein [Ilumatobacteraceae bacterium]
MPWTTSDRVMQLRERHATIDVFVDTLDGWRRHLSGRNASVLAFFGFLSIFPLMLAATTILGFVLEGNDDLQQRIIDGALADIPVLGQQLEADPSSLGGNWWALIIGLGAALWSATKAFVALQGAQDDVWEVAVDHRDAMPHQRAKALLGLVFIGAAQVGSVAITSVVNAAGLPEAGRIGLLAATAAINIGVLAAMFRYLTAAGPTWRDVWPGAVIAGLLYSVLQYFGTGIVRQITNNAGDTYGQFALVLGLVTWLSLLSISALMSTEFNAALVRHRDGGLDRVQPPDAVEPTERPAPASASA